MFEESAGRGRKRASAKSIFVRALFIVLSTPPTYPPGPLTLSSSLLDSILPSPAQTAPCASQSVVTGSTMVTSAL